MIRKLCPICNLPLSKTNNGFTYCQKAYEDNNHFFRYKKSGGRAEFLETIYKNTYFGYSFEDRTIKVAPLNEKGMPMSTKMTSASANLLLSFSKKKYLNILNSILKMQMFI